MYTLHYIDTCLPEYFGGHDLPVIQVVVNSETTNFSLKESLKEYEAIDHLEELELDYSAYKAAIDVCFVDTIAIHKFEPSSDVEASSEDGFLVCAFFTLDIN